jgi:hypothetical protein
VRRVIVFHVVGGLLPPGHRRRQPVERFPPLGRPLDRPEHEERLDHADDGSRSRRPRPDGRIGNVEARLEPMQPGGQERIARGPIDQFLPPISAHGWDERPEFLAKRRDFSP